MMAAISSMILSYIKYQEDCIKTNYSNDLTLEFKIWLSNTVIVRTMYVPTFSKIIKNS